MPNAGGVRVLDEFLHAGDVACSVTALRSIPRRVRSGRSGGAAPPERPAAVHGRGVPHPSPDVPFGRPGGLIVQAGEVRSQGLELDLETSLAANWRVNVGYGYTNSEFLDYEESPGVNQRGHTTRSRRAIRSTCGAGRVAQRIWRQRRHPVPRRRLRRRRERIRGGRLRPAQPGRALPARPARVRGERQQRHGHDVSRPHLDYLQVYPGQPATVLATVRARFR